MKKLIFLLVAALVLCPLTMADEILLKRDKQDSNIVIAQDNLNSREKASLVLECYVNAIMTEDVATDEGNFTKLWVSGWQYTQQAGEPQLPILSRIVEVPLGGKVSVNVLASTKIEGDADTYNISHPIYPNQPSVRRDQKEVPFAYDRAAYNESFSRAPIAKVEELGIMRSARLVQVTFYPVEYSPAESKFRLHSDIKVELTVEDAQMAATMEMKEKYSSKYFNFASLQFMQPASLAVQFQERSIGYLIVADKMFEGNDDLLDFIDHKKDLGYNVIVKYVSGATIEQVSKIVADEYAASHPVFLLFVGDHEQIPGKYISGSGCYTDLYYHSTLVGGASDYVPDMLCGRFSASNAGDLQAQIVKTIAYENKQFPEPGFLNRYALVAGWDSGWAVKRGYPQIRYAVKYYFNDGNGYVAPVTGSTSDQNVFLTTGSGQSVSKIVALVDKGVGFFNYTAHGSETNFSDPSFTASHIDSLSNYGKYPLVIGNCCLTGSFQIATCFGEKWLRAKDKGAVGYIGGSSYTYWDEDLWFGVGYCSLTTDVNAGNPPDKNSTGIGMYECGFGEFVKANEIPAAFRIQCNAAVMYAGNMAVMASTSSRKKYYWEVYHMFGDPSLPTYWAHK